MKIRPVDKRVAPHGRMDRQKETKLTLAFRNSANTPKKENC